MKIVAPPLAFFLALALLAAGNSGASSFVLQRLYPSLTQPSPAIYFALALGFCLACFRPVPRHTLALFASFGLLTAYLALTTLWTDGVTYRDDKLLRTIVGPPIFLIGGYFVGRRGAVDWFAAALGLLAMVVSAAVFVGGEGIDQSLGSLLASDEGTTLDYQRFSILCGAAAAVLIPLLNRRAPLLTLVVVPLVFCAFASGGRTGALLVGVGLLARLSLYLPARILVPATIAGLGAGFFFLNPALQVLTGVAEDVGAPDSLLRALYAAVEPPSITRIWNRPEFLRAAMEAWLSHPFIGTGWGGYPTAVGLPDHTGFYPHNILAELLAETGLIGFTLALIWFALAIERVRHIVAAPDERRYLASVWAFILCGIATAMFVGDWPFHSMLFIGLGLGVGCHDSVWTAMRGGHVPTSASDAKRAVARL